MGSGKSHSRHLEPFLHFLPNAPLPGLSGYLRYFVASHRSRERALTRLREAMSCSMWLTAGLTAPVPQAHLTRETLAALKEAEAAKQPSFLLVPDDGGDAALVASAAKSFGESLPQVARARNVARHSTQDAAKRAALRQWNALGRRCPLGLQPPLWQHNHLHARRCGRTSWLPPEAPNQPNTWTAWPADHHQT